MAVEAPGYWTVGGVAFIIAFMGWMPIPIDASVWHSIWSRERARQTGYRPTVRQAKIDYDLGYVAAAVIGVLFFLLGALVMFGGGQSFPAGAVAFSAQLIDMYGQTLGTWSAPLVSVAAFTTMFSTTLAVTDAYPRVAVEVMEVQRGAPMTKEERRRCYIIAIIVVPAVSVGILAYVSGVFTRLVDFATGLSFVSAPVLAWFNLRLITSDQMPEDARPGPAYLAFSWASLVVLIALALVYLYWKFVFGA
jgi:Mn2+/Fe2+ NRAMP family transporter